MRLGQRSAPDGEASVSDLTDPLGLSQPTVSHHLRILTEAGLLEREKRLKRDREAEVGRDRDRLRAAYERLAAV